MQGAPGSGNRLKRQLVAGDACYVFAVRTVLHAGVVRLAKAAEYDGLYVDFQHSPISIESAMPIYQAALFAGVVALSRVPSIEPGLIGRILDSGGQGIMLADVRDAAQARALVDASLLAPLGSRSLGTPYDPRFPGLTGQALADAINLETLLIAMVETVESVDRMDEIARVPGIDAVQIGCADLTASMGCGGNYAHPDLVAVVRRAVTICESVGKPLLLAGVRRTDQVQAFVAAGIARCYFTGSDTAFLVDGAGRAREMAVAADGAP